MKTCVLIPSYNGESTIPQLVQEVVNYVDRCLVVDDGSTDQTADYASRAGAMVIRHGRNRGKGISLRSGFDWALREGYDAVITMDGDGQHDPKDIPRFIERAKSSRAGLIMGNRMENVENMPAIRRLTNRVMSLIISRICSQRIPDSQCGYRLIKQEVLERLSLATSRFETESEILIKVDRANFEIDSIPIRTIYRDERSRINPLPDAIRFLRLIISGR